MANRFAGLDLADWSVPTYAMALRCGSLALARLTKSRPLGILVLALQVGDDEEVNVFAKLSLGLCASRNER